MEHLPNDWDVLQKSLQASVLQSQIWASVQEAVGRSTYFQWSNHWSWVGFEHKARGIRYLVVPSGPTARLKGSDSLQSIMKLAESEGFDFVQIEPMGAITAEQLKSIGAIKVAEVDPEHTQIIDLAKTEEELRADLKSGHRNRINGASRRGVEVSITSSAEDFESFLGMLRDTAKRAKVTFYPNKYYRDIYKVMAPKGSIKLYIAKVDGQPIAAAMFYDYGGTRYYSHSGAFQTLNRQYKAMVYLLWVALLDAKQLGYSKIDLCGVAPNDDSGHKWAGLTTFKKGYGGKTVSYLGTYDIPINKSKYKVFSFYRKLRGRG